MYKYLLVLSFVLLVSILPCNSQADDPNLLARYTFDNSDAADSSGYGRDGAEVTDLGTLSYVAGKDGMALSLSGGSYINCGGYDDFDDAVDPYWGVIEKDISFMAWVKVEEDQFVLDKQAVFCRGDNFRMNRYNQTNRMRIWVNGGQVSSTIDVNDGQWHHIAGVHDGQSRKMYVDGVLENSVQNQSTTLAGSEDPDYVLIGKDSINGGIYEFRDWNGCIDDVRLYNRVVTPKEMLEIAGRNTAQYQSPDGQMDMGIELELSWIAAYSESRAFNVYYGTDSNSVAGSQPGSLFGDTVLVQDHDSTTLNLTVQSDSSYYWRVDVVDGQNIYSDEEIHVFGTALANSHGFSPSDGQTEVPANAATLTWVAGSLPVTGYNVYLGTNYSAVDSGLASAKVSSSQMETIYTPAMLQENAMYYWKIEDVGETTVSSAVMSFVTAEPVDPNLVGWWKFDDLENPMILDSSGNVHNGTLVGTGQKIVDPEMGNVMSLSEAHIDLGNDEWTDIRKAITVSAWVNVSEYTKSYQAVMAKGNSTHRMCRLGGTQIGGYINTSAGQSKIQYTDEIQGMGWKHVVITYDSEVLDNNYRIYVNGIFQAAATASGLINSTTASLWIGGNDGTDRDWNGLLDDVRLYNRALTSKEISGLYQEVFPPDYVVIDDMEDYDDITKPIDGVGGWRDNDYNRDPGGHTFIGKTANLQPAFLEQSLGFIYNNQDLSHWMYYNSECVKIFNIPQDWTDNLAMLTINVHGSPYNISDKLYVALEDQAGNDFTIYHTDPNILLADSWQIWEIPLNLFTGVDLTKVTMLYLGCGTRFDLDWQVNVDERSGTVYFDNITVNPPSCHPEIQKPDGDFTDDCVVDLMDIQVMANDWLLHDTIVVPEPVSDSNLESFWDFDDSDATDKSGNGHDCNEVGTISYVYDANRGGMVLSLDGTAGSHLNAGGGNGGWATFTKSVTYCAWIKVDEFTKNMQCLIGTNGSYRLGRNGETNSMRLWNDGIGGTLAGNSDVADNQWHHACGVVERLGGTTTTKIYVDGVLENSDSSSKLIKPLVTDLIIGADGENYPDREWNGMVDDVRIYSRALSHGEILTLAEQTETLIIEAETIANIAPDGTPGEEIVNHKDFGVIADNWLDELLWP